MSSIKLPSLSSVFRGDDFRLSSWLALGACLSSLSTLLFPRWITISVPLLLIFGRVLRVYLMTKGIVVDPSNVVKGRWTARIPREASPEKKTGVVMFILGARTLHPLGRLAPGLRELGTHFGAAWKDAETNREKWGYLGRAPILYGATGDGGTTMIWLTYWKDLERLQAFAHGESHRILWDGYLAKRFSNLGIMHETYHANGRDWETIYHNFHPFGMGDVKFYENDEKFESPLMQAQDPQLKTMFGRLGKD